MSEELKPSTRQTSSLGPWSRVAVGAEGVTEPGEREIVRVMEGETGVDETGDRGGRMTDSLEEKLGGERGGCITDSLGEKLSRAWMLDQDRNWGNGI